MNFKPLILIFTAFCLIVGGDTAGKILSQNGMSSFLVAWLRFVIAAIVVLPFCGLKISELPNLFDKMVLLRGVLIAFGITGILTALQTVPIADAFGAFFISPVVSYFLSVLLLGEKITKERTILLFIGLIGVLLVVKPGFGANIGILFALAAGCFHGSYMVATRKVAGDYRPRFLLISQLFVGSIFLAPVMAKFSLPPLGQYEIILLLLSALGSAAGNFIIVIVSRNTPASVISPLVYTQLIAATGYGYFVFGTWPDVIAFTGLVLILASGFASLILSQR